MLARMLKPWTEVAYTLMRIVAGLMFSFHGMQKILGVFDAPKAALWTQQWVGGVIELVCGLAIAVGLFTSVTAFLASGTMFVAYVQFHWKFQFGAQFIPNLNKGELALLYCVVFFFIACRGGGWRSEDARRAGSSGTG